LVSSWRLGQRDLATAKDFVNDLASRLSKRVQITSDGHRPYLEAIEGALGSEVDYSQLHKIYGATSVEDFRRYTRLSNGFSRKLENHAAATALNYFNDNVFDTGEHLNCLIPIQKSSRIMVLAEVCGFGFC